MLGGAHDGSTSSRGGGAGASIIILLVSYSQSNKAGNSSQNCSRGGNIGSWCDNMFDHSDSNSCNLGWFFSISIVGSWIVLYEHFFFRTFKTELGSVVP